MLWLTGDVAFLSLSSCKFAAKTGEDLRKKECLFTKSAIF